MEEQSQRSTVDETNALQQQWHTIPDDFLEQVYRVREQVIKDSKGELFEDSTELIRHMREERTRELMGEEIMEEQTENNSATATDEPQLRRHSVTPESLERLMKIREQII